MTYVPHRRRKSGPVSYQTKTHRRSRPMNVIPYVFVIISGGLSLAAFLTSSLL